MGHREFRMNEMKEKSAKTIISERWYSFKQNLNGQRAFCLSHRWSLFQLQSAFNTKSLISCLMPTQRDALWSQLESAMISYFSCAPNGKHRLEEKDNDDNDSPTKDFYYPNTSKCKGSRTCGAFHSLPFSISWCH